MTIDKSNPVSGPTGHVPAVSAPAGRDAAPKVVKKKPEAAPAPDPIVAKSAEKSDDTAKATEVDSGKYNDYKVSSDYELIISVKNRQTNEEIRQIPSKEHQAVKQAISETIDHLIDKTV